MLDFLEQLEEQDDQISFSAYLKYQSLAKDLKHKKGTELEWRKYQQYMFLLSHILYVWHWERVGQYRHSFLKEDHS